MKLNSSFFVGWELINFVFFLYLHISETNNPSNFISFLTRVFLSDILSDVPAHALAHLPCHDDVISTYSLHHNHQMYGFVFSMKNHKTIPIKLHLEKKNSVTSVIGWKCIIGNLIALRLPPLNISDSHQIVTGLNEAQNIFGYDHGKLHSVYEWPNMAAQPINRPLILLYGNLSLSMIQSKTIGYLRILCYHPREFNHKNKGLEIFSRSTHSQRIMTENNQEDIRYKNESQFEFELAIQENSSARSTKGVAQTAPRVIHPGLSPGLETQKKHFYYYFIHWPFWSHSLVKRRASTFWGFRIDCCQEDSVLLEKVQAHLNANGEENMKGMTKQNKADLRQQMTVSKTNSLKMVWLLRIQHVWIGLHIRLTYFVTSLMRDLSSELTPLFHCRPKFMLEMMFWCFDLPRDLAGVVILMEPMINNFNRNALIVHKYSKLTLEHLQRERGTWLWWWMWRLSVVFWSAKKEHNFRAWYITRIGMPVISAICKIRFSVDVEPDSIRDEAQLSNDKLLTRECTKVRMLKIIPQFGKPLASPGGGYKIITLSPL
ncbi:putative signal peptide protein [Puccinia sorghi]|uniref:Putative signal peptide protein n=1 Tax=Puccinia sorghi TaxID=27349 RepID=A0A0L6VNF4_9BASI|nr:putative signal peptide protein [Puccinia sorghi]